MALTRNQVSEIRLRLNNGEKGCNLAKEFGVSNAYISQIKSHKKGMRQVWLTIEEAEILTRCAANEFCRLIMEHAPVDLARQVEVVMYDLVKRIKEAEKQDG